MQRSKLYFYLIYLLLAVLVVLWSVNFYRSKPLPQTQKTIAELNEKVWDHYLNPIETNCSIRHIWGLKPKAPKSPKNPPKVVKPKETSHKPTVKKREICLDKICYRLLGLYEKNQQYRAVFYTNNPKYPHAKIKEYHQGDLLFDHIYIKEISLSEIVLEDKLSQELWDFQVFYVNPNKYKPKPKDHNVSIQ